MTLDEIDTAARKLPVPEAARRALLGACAAAIAGLVACTKQDATAAAATPPQVPPTPQTPATAPPGQARKIFDAAAGGAGFDVGEAMSARLMHVFFDPQCPHCGALWKASRPLADRLRMHWMPVAFMNPSSAPQGAMLLKAPDPVALMDQHEALLLQGQGGIAVTGPADAVALASVKSNTGLWQSLKAGSVPYAVYRAGSDGPFGVQEGQLSTDELARLFGL